MTYSIRRVPRLEMRRVRDLNMRLTYWGLKAFEPAASSAPLVLLLHGFQDTGATFQFMVDQCASDRPLVALDWRGFGGSEWPSDGYWFPDYLADLDALLDELSPEAPVCLVGHSMGGNVASLYSGVRPERVRCVVNLEGFGMPRTQPADSPGRLRRWLGEIRTGHTFKEYESLSQLAEVIRFRYPRFPLGVAEFVAAAWSSPVENGRVRLLGDPRHRRVNPILYKREDAEACWRAAKAPTLIVLGEESEILERFNMGGDFAAFRSFFPAVEIANIAAAGHMMHIEKPREVAALVEAFLNVHG